MRYLAGFLDIQFDDILLVPTFNRSPIEVNTNSGTVDRGVANRSVSRAKTSTGRESNSIEGITSEKYSLLLKETVRFE
jgi:hypothetical protein